MGVKSVQAILECGHKIFLLAFTFLLIENCIIPNASKCLRSNTLFSDVNHLFSLMLVFQPLTLQMHF